MYVWSTEQRDQAKTVMAAHPIVSQHPILLAANIYHYLYLYHYLSSCHLWGIVFYEPLTAGLRKQWRDDT